MEVLKSNPKIHIKFPELVDKKIQKLASDGPSALQVVSDFDNTMSCAYFESQKVKSSFCAVEDDPRILSDEVREQCRAVNAKYVAIEADPELSREEKIPHMMEWWSTTFTRFADVGVTDELLKDIAEKGSLPLRSRTLDMLKLLDKHNIPCLVFSAGLGEIVSYTLQHAKAQLPNVTVISNYFTFRKTPDGVKAEAPKHILHAYNKNGEFPAAVEYFSKEEIKARRNAILLGDNLGDSHMVDGAPGFVADEHDLAEGEVGRSKGSTVLKIGFLDKNIDQRLPTFMDSFDIVLIDDQTMDVPLEILNEIVRTT